LGGKKCVFFCHQSSFGILPWVICLVGGSSTFHTQTVIQNMGCKFLNKTLSASLKWIIGTEYSGKVPNGKRPLERNGMGDIVMNGERGGKKLKLKLRVFLIWNYSTRCRRKNFSIPLVETIVVSTEIKIYRHFLSFLIAPFELWSLDGSPQSTDSSAFILDVNNTNNSAFLWVFF
jgi:hypothetical protein